MELEKFALNLFRNKIPFQKWCRTLLFDLIGRRNIDSYISEGQRVKITTGDHSFDSSHRDLSLGI